MPYAELTVRDRNPVKRWLQRRRFSDAVSVLNGAPAGGQLRVLDSGAGDGELVRQIAGNPRIQAWAYEPTPALMAEARENLAGLDAVILTQNLDSAGSGTFDYVFSLLRDRWRVHRGRRRAGPVRGGARAGARGSRRSSPMGAVLYVLVTGRPSKPVRRAMMYRKVIDGAVESGIEEEIPLSILGVKKEYLESAFDEMETQFGSIENYFSEGLGIVADQQQALRDLYLQ